MSSTTEQRRPQLEASGESKWAVITGGTKGLGLALSRRLALEGLSVVALFRDDRQAAAALTSWWTAHGLPGSVEQCDLTDERQVDEVFARIAAEGKRIGWLIHNAAPAFQPTAERRLTWSDFERQLDGLQAAVRSSRKVVPEMLRSGGGTLVFVLSSAILDRVPAGFAHYATAKAALLGYARSLAGEYGDRGLRVHCFAPGLMETAMTAAWPEPLRAWAFGERRENLVDPDVVAARICALVLGQDPPALEPVRIERESPPGESGR